MGAIHGLGVSDTADVLDARSGDVFMSLDRRNLGMWTVFIPSHFSRPPRLSPRAASGLPRESCWGQPPCRSVLAPEPRP